MAKQIKRSSSNKAKGGNAGKTKRKTTTATTRKTSKKVGSSSSRKKKIKYEILEPKTLIIYIVIGVALAIFILLPKSCVLGEKNKEDKDSIEMVNDSIKAPDSL